MYFHIAAFLCLTITLHADRWAVLVYADPCADITGALVNNINEIVRAHPSDTVDISVQFRIYSTDTHAKIWRYRINGSSLHLEERLEDNASKKDSLIAAAQWAFSSSTADHHALIVTGHGCGILEPTWNQQADNWQVEDDEAFQHICPISRTSPTRALLLDDYAHTYIDNNAMIDSCWAISRQLGKKLDILALDLCLGACLEHTYQLHESVHYLIGCQNCELPEGFDYYTLAQRLSSTPTPEALAIGIVHDYDAYYHGRTPRGTYTLSAIDCSYSTKIHAALDRLAHELISLLFREPQWYEKIYEIREAALHFCFMPVYTDLYTIVAALDTALPTDKEYEPIHTYAAIIKTAIERAVIANAHGHALPMAHGINIYFPYSHIDSSYANTRFARDNQWFNLLRLLTSE